MRISLLFSYYIIKDIIIHKISSIILIISYSIIIHKISYSIILILSFLFYHSYSIILIYHSSQDIFSFLKFNI